MLKPKLLRYVLGDNFRFTIHNESDVPQNNEATHLTIHLLYVCASTGILYS